MSDLAVRYELWIERREPWLGPVEGAEQHREDRPHEEAAGPSIIEEYGEGRQP